MSVILSHSRQTTWNRISNKYINPVLARRRSILAPEIAPCSRTEERSARTELIASVIKFGPDPPLHCISEANGAQYPRIVDWGALRSAAHPNQRSVGVVHRSGNPCALDRSARVRRLAMHTRQRLPSAVHGQNALQRKLPL